MISRNRSGSRWAASAVESARSANRTVTILRSSLPSSAVGAPQFGQNRASGGSGFPQRTQVRWATRSRILGSDDASVSVRALRGSKAARQLDKHLPGDRRVAVEKRSELPGGQRQRAHRAVRLHGCGSRAAIDKRHFSEIVSRTELRLRVIADDHVRLALQDQVEADSGSAFLDDLATGGVLDLLGRVHHCLELFLRQSLEDRNRFEHRFCVTGSCHSLLPQLPGIIDERDASETGSSMWTVYSRTGGRQHDFLREDSHV